MNTTQRTSHKTQRLSIATKLYDEIEREDCVQLKIKKLATYMRTEPFFLVVNEIRVVRKAADVIIVADGLKVVC